MPQSFIVVLALVATFSAPILAEKTSDAPSEQTAQSQSHSKADMEITRQIRSRLVEDTSLSLNAHNVKVITQQGQVVLRGPVASAQEKNKVESIARLVAGAESVTSHLTIE